MPPSKTKQNCTFFIAQLYHFSTCSKRKWIDTILSINTVFLATCLHPSGSFQDNALPFVSYFTINRHSLSSQKLDPHMLALLMKEITEIVSDFCVSPSIFPTTSLLIKNLKSFDQPLAGMSWRILNRAVWGARMMVFVPCLWLSFLPFPVVLVQAKGEAM